MQTEREPVPDRARLWLDQIVELTKEEGVDLILIKTPYTVKTSSTIAFGF